MEQENIVFTKAEKAKIKFLGTLEKGNYVGEIFDDGECYSAYITKANYGLKSYMFGLPKIQQSFEVALEIFMANFDEYIDAYEDDINILEEEFNKRYFNKTAEPQGV